ncbi:uncharacterized protein LOC105009809 isoform X2 [Esox lucius]|uniref:uncharacterized protein LOC105009809 isoform X2 n=1 Tax=Esox lucius TaxID=8010 RepID=UPI001476D22F|nr:uncharacterized protein LOC105009809 isoform X2 [Esox lucius]
MDGVHHTLIQLLILKLLSTGVFGELSSTYMYNILGDDVNMPCKNLVYPVNCNSVGWIHLKTGSRNAIQQVSEGKVRVDSNRAERLTLKPNCSLTVHNVTSEDVGKYRCQTGNIDSLTHLSLLTISSSTPESDLKPDYPLTLRCTLHTPFGPGMCRYGELDKISLGWVDQTRADLQDVSRYHFTVHSTCDITLNVTLQREDINRRWTCQLTDKGKVKTSIYFHSTLSDVDKWVVIGVVVFVAVFVVITTLVIFTKRTRIQMPVNTGHMMLANNSDGEQADITYSVVNIPAGSSVMNRDPKTEYATIRTRS